MTVVTELDLPEIDYNQPDFGPQTYHQQLAEARKHGWHVFETRVRYSGSYAKAMREGTPIGRTSHARWYVASEFSQFVEEFLPTVGLAEEDT